MNNMPNGDPSINGKYFYSESIINANEQMTIGLVGLRSILEKYGFLRDQEKEQWEQTVETFRQKTQDAFGTLRYLAKRQNHPRFVAIDEMFDLGRRLDSAVRNQEYSRALRLAFLISELNYFWLYDDLSWEAGMTTPGDIPHVS